MSQLLLAVRNRSFRVTVFALLTAVVSVASAQVESIRYELQDVFLQDGSQMTGAFDWTYTVGDFEGGSGVFTDLQIPWRPNGTVPPLEQEGMIFTIEDKQIEISLDGNFHDYGLDISLKFFQTLSPTQPSLLDLNTSFFECCGNGFKDQPFIAGSVVPTTTQVASDVSIDIEPNDPDNYVETEGNYSDMMYVAILGNPDFDATQVDATTLALGPTEAAALNPPGIVRDADGDGNADDLQLKFRIVDTGITCEYTEPVDLTGRTFSGDVFSASGSITTPDCPTAGCHP
jgi:hypothetical protein